MTYPGQLSTIILERLYIYIYIWSTASYIPAESLVEIERMTILGNDSHLQNGLII
jgi:hypothetical protein